MAIILVAVLIMVPAFYRVWVANYFPWFVDGILISFVAFVIALAFDRPLRPWLGLHHIPELSLAMFLGSMLGAFFSWFTIVVGLLFPAGSLLILSAPKRLKSHPDPQRPVAGDVVIFTVMLWIGLVIGVLLR